MFIRAETTDDVSMPDASPLSPRLSGSVTFVPANSASYSVQLVARRHRQVLRRRDRSQHVALQVTDLNLDALALVVVSEVGLAPLCLQLVAALRGGVDLVVELRWGARRNHVQLHRVDVLSVLGLRL